MRPLSVRDHELWREIRQRNRSWLAPWDASVPPGTEGRPRSFTAMVRAMRWAARSGRMLPFVIEYDGKLVGQLTVNNIVRGSGQFGSVGYWIDEQYAGRGITTRAVAMAIDHCFTRVGLHRVEVAIRPENVASLRVVEKLGIEQIGYAPKYLHIDGCWRDHLIFAITTEDAPDGLLARLG